MPRLASLSRLPVPSRSSGLSRFSSLSLLSALGLFAWALLGLSACDKGPARECDSRFDCPAPFVCDEGSSTCVDPAGGTFCTSSASCTDATKPFCYIQAGTCVACLTQGSNNECANRLVCDGQRTCTFCTLDEDCIGNSAEEKTLCLRTGGCAEQKDVAYVSTGTDGTDNTMCTVAAPCTSLAKALATGRPYIRLRGDIPLNAPLAISQKVTIYGTKTTRLRITNSTGGDIFTISGTEAIELRDLELSGSTTGAGIRVTSGTPKLDLDNVDVIGNGGGGIIANTAALHVQRSLIVNNGGGGITASAPVILENNIIVGNGSATSVFGGLQLVTSDAANVVRFNTFAGNNAMGGVGRSVSCSATTVTLSSNIFADAAPVSMCTTKYSLFPAGTTVTLPDQAGDPMFASTALPPPNDPKRGPERNGFTYYHLQDGSPATDVGEPLDTGVPEDFEGEPRGKAGKEIGADEIN